MEILSLTAAVLLGACVGSFLNVCIHRLPRGVSIVRPRSACPACAAPIAWYDNLPVVSFLLLRGRCRRCGAGISPRYPLVEGASAALFGLLFAVRGPTVEWALEAFFGAAIIALILIDAEHQILPDAITLPGIALGLAGRPLEAWLDAASKSDAVTAFLRAAIGALSGYLLLYAMNGAYRGWQALRSIPEDRREDGIGRGDFKLLAMIGALLGTRLMLFTLFCGAVAGSLWGAYLMLRHGAGLKSKLPYGVFLGGAAIAALFVGAPAIRWYLTRAGLAP